MSIAISVNTPALGDTLAAIPTIRKVSKAYETSITVFTQFPELFQNHPCVKEAFPLNAPKEGYNVLNTFSHLAGKTHNLNGNKVQFKHSHIDIRQFHALSLGFSLLPEEMEIDLYIEEEWEIGFKNYIVIHPTNTWGSRTWDDKKWQDLVYKLNNKNIPVVAIGKRSTEQGNREIYNKTVMDIDISYGINLMDSPESTIGKIRGLFKNAKALITMDSGILHVGGTTDVHIIQLGSSINPKFRSPYRKGSQDYKYNYVGGKCDLFCASNLRYNVKEHGSIQGVPPLANCLEQKSTFECHSKVKDVVDAVTSLPSKEKLLIIATHLSTGGSPQYLLDFLNHYKSNYSDIKLVEFSNFSSTYTIQKNKIIKLLGEENLITLGEFIGVSDDVWNADKEKLIPLLKQYNPDVVWMNEFPEAYDYKSPPKKVMDVLYSKDRTYKIIETTHNNSFDFKSKIYIPDEFMFCSEKHMKDSKCIDIPKRVWEVPIVKKSRPNRENTLMELGLDPSKYHVLHVGLLHSNKNQKYIFELAEQTTSLQVQYHFIGNHCFINDIGLTDTQRSLPNCKLWGERDDVNKFMSCMDLYLFPSKKELNPLTVKEALSWEMEVIVNFDKNYTDQYKDLPNFRLIQDTSVINFIAEKSSGIKNFIPPTQLNKISISYCDGVKISISNENPSSYDVKFFNHTTNKLVYEATVQNGMWTKPNIKYYIKWRVEVWQFGKKIIEDILDLTNKKVYISFESKAIGDTIAWFPYVEEFRKKHNCEVICSTFHNNWFKPQYPEIQFITPGNVVKDLHASYKIGWFYDNDQPNSDYHSNDFKSQPLQKTASDILGLEYKELIPEIKELPLSPIKEKYITISVQSTSQAKYWNHPTGWEQVVKYLQDKGYKVVVVDKHRTFGIQGFMNTLPKNALDYTGKSLDETISLIKEATLHIGISSGLSWVAWALKTPVMLISSFSKPWCEFQSNCIRIYDNSPTAGYFNTHKMDASNWNWYPFKEINSMKDWYEIETITPEQVIGSLNKIL